MICRNTTKTLSTQNGDNSWACMLQGKAYDYNMIECFVSNDCRLQRIRNKKKTMETRRFIVVHVIKEIPKQCIPFRLLRTTKKM
jgi:hypothetical protein